MNSLDSYFFCKAKTSPDNESAANKADGEE